MTWLRIFASRFSALFRKRRLEQEMNEEMRTHLDMLIEENVYRGMLHEEARYSALQMFGGIDQVKESSRDQREWPMFETVIHDIRCGLRPFHRSPRFTAVVVLSLTLGIGANTTIFSLIDAVMLKMLPTSHPYQLIQPAWSPAKWPDAVLHDLEGSTFKAGAKGAVTSG